MREISPSADPMRLFRSASEADREPGSSFVEHFLHGAGQVPVALRALFQDRSLRRAALVPTLLGTVGAAAIATLDVWFDWGGDDVGWHWALRRFFTVFLAFAALPPTLLHPLWVKLAIAARRSLGLETVEANGHSYLRTLIAESKKAFRQMIIGGTIGLFPVLIVVAFLPGDKALRPLLLGAWAIYWIQLDAFEVPFELSGMPIPQHSPWFARWAHGYGSAGKWWSLRIARRIGRWLHKMSRPWRREIAFTERHAPACFGFAVALAVIFFFPALGLLFRPVAIIAATRLAAREPRFREPARERASA